MKRFATIVFLCFCAVGLNLVPSTMAQALSGEARSHWNKALIYMENAKAEDEWQMAVNELEQVISLAPDFTEAYLKLGDSYSQLSSSEVVEKAKYYWREYEKRTPRASTEIQDKIDSLEAHYEISVLRNREAIIESLVGRWRSNKDSTNDFYKDFWDIEIFREGDKLMLGHVTELISYDGINKKSEYYHSYMEIPLNDDNIVVEYKVAGITRKYKNGKYDGSFSLPYVLQFVFAQPQVDGVIKGTKRVDYVTTSEYIYLYKVN